MSYYNSKSMRIVTQEPGAFFKPLYSPSSSQKDSYRRNSALIWFRPKHIYVQHRINAKNSGHVTMKNGARYWISKDTWLDKPVNMNNSGFAMWYHDSIFANVYKDGKSHADQQAGFTHIVSDYNGKNSPNNGYAFEFLTDESDRFNGASPMKVVGLCFRMPSWDKLTWKGPSYPQGMAGSFSKANGTGWPTSWAMSDDNAGGDRWINRMHLTYIDSNGSLKNKAVLPEGKNIGDYVFSNMDDPKSYTSWWDSKSESYYGRATDLKDSRMVRVWHNENIPDDWYFCGFSMSWYIGYKANIHKRHHMTIAGLVPILRSDLDIITGGGKNKMNNVTRTLEPYCTSRADALSRKKKQTDSEWTPSQPDSQKLWIVSDPDHENMGENGARSIVKDNVVWKYPP